MFTSDDNLSPCFHRLFPAKLNILHSAESHPLHANNTITFSPHFATSGEVITDFRIVTLPSKRLYLRLSESYTARIGFVVNPQPPRIPACSNLVRPTGSLHRLFFMKSYEGSAAEKWTVAAGAL